ncbi:hypothetical protein GALL_365730 [mine drainage metagenome]|uniref:NAD-specific glutamate dehydrogenase n=1 Tax=mine drainage metagenome TaxID=410659 RepID=A0A1J5QDG4_9ZZZZ
MQAGFVLAQLGEELLLLLGRHAGQLAFQLGADGDHGRVLLRRVLAQAVEVGVVLEAVLHHVADEHGRLGGDQAQRLDQRHLVVRQAHGAYRDCLVQRLLAALQHLDGLERLLVAGAALLVQAVDGLLHGAEVGQAQLGLDDADVGQRVDMAGDVDHVLVLEAAHDVDDGVGFADVGEELVAQAFALAGAGHEPGDVDELHHGRQHALRLDDGGELLQTRIGHLDHAHIGFDGAEGVVLGGDGALGQRVEERGLAHVGQSHDAAFEAHGRWCGGKARIVGGHPRRAGRTAPRSGPALLGLVTSAHLRPPCRIPPCSSPS